MNSADDSVIRKLSIRWLGAMKEKNIGLLSSMVTDDVVFLPPAFPAVRGREAVEAMYRMMFSQFDGIEQSSSIEEIEVAGEWAFVWGSESTVLNPKGGGNPIRMQGKGMSLPETADRRIVEVCASDHE